MGEPASLTKLDSKIAVLLLKCDAKINAVARVTQYFTENGQPLSKLVQFSDAHTNLVRATWIHDDDDGSEDSISRDISTLFSDELVANSWGQKATFECTVRFPFQGLSVGLICSSQTHVLSDVLSLAMSSSRTCVRVPFVIGSDDAAGKVADRFGVPYFCIPDQQGADEIARRQREIIERYRPNVLGLARYDALLAQSVIQAARCPILAVHNSFLRTVKGEKAFQLAHEQGEKLVGATSRFVEDGSAGPIIQQDVIALGPGISQENVIALGQRIERKVFTESLRKLVEHKVMVYNAKTIVFD